MTQCEMILRHLREVGGITQAEAMSEYGCYRLAARIADLKEMGHKIRSQSEEKRNRFGKKVTYARYFLSPDDKR